MTVEEARKWQWADHETRAADRRSLDPLGHQIVELAGHLKGNVEVHVLDDGAIRFTAPNGRSFDSTLPDHTLPLADWHQLVASHDEQGLHIDRHTAAARLHGDGYDHGIAIDSLLRRARGGPSPAVC